LIRQPPRGAPSPGVAIIGAGFSGIAAAVALKREGIEDFTIFDTADGVGGTWWANRYPGAEVDLESHIYSFSFARADWTRTHASRRELQAYLEAVVDRFGLRPHLRLGEKIETVRWVPDQSGYEITTSSGELFPLFSAVISAVGFLNMPVVPGFARFGHPFEGEITHTSTWPEGLDLTGRRVGVLGTGSSAVQVVAEAARQAASVKVFQSSPNWILPKGSRDYSERERRRNRNRLVHAWRRSKLYLTYDVRQYRASHARPGGWSYERRARAALDHLSASLAGHPELRGLVTPPFAFEGKRTVLSDNYYSALTRPNVTVVPHAVSGLTATGAVCADGAEHALDVIVLATGFDAANYLGSFTVTGVGGVELHDQWNGEPQALLGLMTPGFPNFFMLYGPNTNSVPLVSFYEAQARFAAKTIARLGRSGRREVHVSQRLTERYNDWLQDRLRRTAWGATRNYYKAGTGRIVSQWPFSASFYIAATRVARHVALSYRSRSPVARAVSPPPATARRSQHPPAARLAASTGRPASGGARCPK
jgi:cation diffusion facilitator CzcD-associated flavoprotein CzcO